MQTRKQRHDQIVRRMKIRRRAWRERLAALKSKPCADCKQSFPHFVMDFDHARGTKVNNLSRMVNRALKWEKVEAEIEKCDLVCSNCHRIRSNARLVQR